jgi:glucose-1-phosphate adenylyltransferase
MNNQIKQISGDTVAVILAGGRGSRLKDLTNEQAKPAVDFGGKYRIVDFSVSNCIHSGIRRICLLTQYQSNSLLRHMQRSWHLNSEMGEFIDLIPAYQKKGDSNWYQGTADAVFQNVDVLKSYGARFVVILAGDHVYKMDYSMMLYDHMRTNADVTVSCVEVPREEASRFGVIHVDQEDRVIDFLEKPAQPPGMPGRPEHALASMGIYIFNADFLYDELQKDADDPESKHDFGGDLLPRLVAQSRVMAHHFMRSCVRSHPDSDAYWRDVGTVDSYWESNLELTRTLPALDLYDSNWPIFTYQEQLPPAKFVFDKSNTSGFARNSIFSPGCIVSGSEIEESLLSCNVRVGPQCNIRNSVLLPHVTVGRDVRLDKVIIDRDCHIPDGLVVGEDPDHDAERFYRTNKGVVMITNDMLRALQ